jgi:hypothetical protein
MSLDVSHDTGVVVLVAHHARRTLSIPGVLSSSEMLQPESWGVAQPLLGCHIDDY